MYVYHIYSFYSQQTEVIKKIFKYSMHFNYIHVYIYQYFFTSKASEDVIKALKTLRRISVFFSYF